MLAEHLDIVHESSSLVNIPNNIFDYFVEYILYFIITVLVFGVSIVQVENYDIRTVTVPVCLLVLYYNTGTRTGQAPWVKKKKKRSSNEKDFLIPFGLNINT